VRWFRKFAWCLLRDEFGADSPVTVDNVKVLLFAGFDTTSSSLTYMPAQHPDVLQKARECKGLSGVGACMK
jgi:hypothetical protein